MPESPALPEQLLQKYSVRYDPIHGWPVFYAPPRAARPFDYQKNSVLKCTEHDPFAAGHEDITTPETFAIREAGSSADGPGWLVRIIPNKYPALPGNKAQCLTDSPALPGSSALSGAPALGVHEVIIECPQSETHFTRLSAEQQQRVFQAIHARLAQLAERTDLASVIVFKNHGQGAGASLAHSHSQLMASPFVFPGVRREVDFCRAYRKEHSADYFARLLETELAAGECVVEEAEHFVALCPRVSRFALEMQILPRSPQPHYHRCTEAELHESSQLLARSLRRLEKILGEPDYNLVLHTAPFHETGLDGFRWHWEIYPRISGIAGFELGAGSFVNAVYPEQATTLLRNTNLTFT